MYSQNIKETINYEIQFGSCCRMW